MLSKLIAHPCRPCSIEDLTKWPLCLYTASSLDVLCILTDDQNQGMHTTLLCKQVVNSAPASTSLFLRQNCCSLDSLSFSCGTVRSKPQEMVVKISVDQQFLRQSEQYVCGIKSYAAFKALTALLFCFF